MTPRTSGSPLDVQAIRADFPILARQVNGRTLTYLDNAATSQTPKQVIQLLVDYYERYNSNVHRGVHMLSIEATEAYEEARGKVARFINAPSPESVIWTRNTSESLNLVAYTWGEANVGAGDEIVTTAMEHHSDIVPWQQLAMRKGATLKIIRETETGRLDMEQAAELITERTKIVAATHMSNVLGTVNDVKALAEAAHRVGAVMLVDGAQSVPHMPVDVQALDCDFMAFSAHKMLGPTGIGVLWGRPELLEVMPPWMFGGDMILEVTYEDASWNDLPYRFEAGTPNIADAIATGAAVDYLTALGMEDVWEHEQQITAYALDKFSGLNGTKVLGPREVDDRGAVISFSHDSVHSHDLGTALDQLGIAIRTGHHCAMPLIRSHGIGSAARASFYIYNTEAEVDILIDGLAEAERYFSKAGIA
ncbi:MAG TPA: cysteine desulfurase [Dehalococcoidia bacterium]|jgi:cysteine desulfurase/selenocysteine lyase|nr:cysteine desulfurase [Chloroflexota bacterium]MDP5876677.1 cysteine desulfurase [Dehalococcoidia bacterium]MDP6272442.1 cysteine desulfurase [Dehalococcoidia bacterium]MDP7160812.1 cysteine desulfurase [Dehalococcoidia bacterium]MDP7213261.1 cysteine desulfurase [Dehalococcoidia bacterium]